MYKYPILYGGLMGKIIVKKDLSLVCSASNRGFPYDGVLKHKDEYYVTCVHGEEDGNLSLELNNEYFYVQPNTLRDVLNTRLGLDLKSSDKIHIIPCFPNLVRSKFGMDLYKNNIKILCHNWNGLTGIIYYDGDFYAMQVNKQTDITIFVGKYSNLRAAANKQTLKRMIIVT